MKLYLEQFLLSVLAALVTALLTAKVSMTARVVAIGSIAALAFLASVVAEKLPSGAAQAKLPTWRRFANVLLPVGIPVLLGYVLLRSGTFQIAQEGSATTTLSAPPVNTVSSASTAPAPLAGSLRSESKAVARRSVDEAAVSPEDAFMKKYVADDGQPYRTGAWTVVISAADRNDLPELHAAAESALSEKGYAARPLFRSTLLQDSAAYDELYAGNPALLRRIGTYRDGVLVGKLRSEISQNTSLDMFTAHLFVDLRVISARPAKMEGQLTIDETGAGFSETAATTAAEHRMADRLKRQLLQSIPPK